MSESEYSGFLSMSPDCSLKYAEDGFVYDKERNELYRVNDDALQFLLTHQNIPRADVDKSDDEVRHFIDYLIDEEIYLPTDTPFLERRFLVDEEHRPPLPSLRYLLLHLTKDCNLRCRHCYVHPNTSDSMTSDVAKMTFEQMQDMQGLIVLLSGGEPLSHPDFWEINDTFPNYNLRFELLSNGTLITPDVAEAMNVQHVQVSLDGMEEAHDFMRGEGTFRQAVEGIENLQEVGKDVSISTMVHKKDVADFDDMERMLDHYGITQWIINNPSVAGRWCENEDNAVPIETAARIMIQYSRGEGPHKSKTNFTCGSHIATVMTNGNVYPCPFLDTDDMLMGRISGNGLKSAWENRKGITVEELEECGSCESLEECRGGCRYRAKEEGNVCGKDSLMCNIYNKDAT